MDISVPAERLAALDHLGSKVRVSGSSYAVARLTALVARMKMQRPYLQAADIIAELRKRHAGTSAAALNWVSSGYIADPLAGGPLKKELLANLDIKLPAAVFSWKPARRSVSTNGIIFGSCWTS